MFFKKGFKKVMVWLIWIMFKYYKSSEEYESMFIFVYNGYFFCVK